MNRFDAIVSADAFENLKPAPDIFLAASKILDVPTNEVCFTASITSFLGGYCPLVLILIYFGVGAVLLVLILNSY